MFQPKRYAVGDGTQAIPTMVHGTSIESVIKMLETGRTFSSFFQGESEHPSHQGYLFFVPRKRSFRNHQLYEQITLDLDGVELERKVLGYAGFAQQQRFLVDTFGEELGRQIKISEMNDCGILEEWEKEGINVRPIAKYGLGKLAEELEQQKGVILGLNDLAIREMNIQNGCDDPGEELMAYLPNGVDANHVRYIMPLGEAEDLRLQPYFAR